MSRRRNQLVQNPWIRYVNNEIPFEVWCSGEPRWDFRTPFGGRAGVCSVPAKHGRKDKSFGFVSSLLRGRQQF
jgi:hypothetical protein